MVIMVQIVFLSLKIFFVLANSVDPDGMLHDATFHLGHQCLPKYAFRNHLYTVIQRVHKLRLYMADEFMNKIH